MKTTTVVRKKVKNGSTVTYEQVQLGKEKRKKLKLVFVFTVKKRLLKAQEKKAKFVDNTFVSGLHFDGKG